MGVQQDVTALIEPLKHVDPRIWQALELLNNQVARHAAELEPLVQQSVAVVTSALPVEAPASFTAISAGATLRFNWSAVVGAAQYELRKGTVWETASFILRSPSLQADVDPVLYGTHTYLLKSISSGGTPSVTPQQVVFSVTTIPAVTISPQVIDNNVLLYWNEPASTFNIDYYEIFKDGVSLTTTSANFASFFETVSAPYTYKIIAYDVAGNASLPSEVEVEVNQPPDFGLQDTRVSIFDGTKVNTIIHNSKLLCCWTAETFQNHFTSRAWLSPQNQVTAGYPIYIQPASTTGSYEEVIDYGALINNVIVIITYNANVITPADPVSVLIRMAVSNDGISYTAFTDGAAQFFTQFRYLKLRLEFSGSDKALMEISSLTTILNVKRENDGGEIAALSTDALGTEVLFNKPFLDVESITATVLSTTEPFTTVVKFTDVPSPTGFHVFAFDTSGNRVSKTVEWKARGIV